MRWWMTYPMTVVDTIFKALAPARARRASIAGHHADLVHRLRSTGVIRAIGALFLYIAAIGPHRRRLGRQGTTKTA